MPLIHPFGLLPLVLFYLPLRAAPPDDRALTTGGPVDIPVLDNDGPASSLSIVAVGQPAHGSATVVNDRIRFLPEAGFYGIDQFSYTAHDGVSTFTATVQVDVVFQGGDCWVPFNECGENVVFEAGGRPLAWLGPGPESPQRIEGKFGYGLRFDGIDDRLLLSELPDSLLPSGSISRTVMAWIRVEPGGAPGRQTILDYGTAEAGKRFTLRLDAANSQPPAGQALRLEVEGGHLVGSALVDDGHWHHVAVVCDDLNGDGTLDVIESRLFVDGQLDPAADVDAQGMETSGGTTASVGAALEPLDSHFAGDLDELRIVPAALSPAEIGELMDSGQPEAEAWHRRHFGPAPVDWSSDSDHDGIDRLVEYAFGGDPHRADAGDVAPAVAPDFSSGTLELSFTRRAPGSHNLFYVLEVSNDLDNWEAVTGFIVRRTLVSPSDCLEEVSLSGSSSLPITPRIFARAGVRFKP